MNKRKCTARTKRGKPCGNPALHERTTCQVHGPPKGDNRLDEALAKHAQLYDMAIEDGDVRSALAVLKDSQKLEGLYERRPLLPKLDLTSETSLLRFIESVTLGIATGDIMLLIAQGVKVLAQQRKFDAPKSDDELTEEHVARLSTMNDEELAAFINARVH
jgi:hypothetical protein